MKKAITLLFTFLILLTLFNCVTEPVNDPRFIDGTVTFHPNGIISSGMLKGDQTFSNITYQINISFRGNISFHPNGQVNTSSLSRWTYLGATEYKWSIAFYDSGLVKKGMLTGDDTLSNVGFLSDTAIYFHSNGIISNGIARNQTIQGIDHNSGQTVRFDINGNIITNQ